MPRALRQPLAWAFSVSDLRRAAALAAAYFLTAKLALLAAIPPGYATAVWPPSGIALAALLLFGKRLWPGVFLGAALVNVAVQSSPLAAILIGGGNTLESVVGALLVQRCLGKQLMFERGDQVLSFVIAACSSASIAATVAGVPLALIHMLPPQELYRNWWTWWQGDAMGIVLLAPLILGWSAREQLAWTPSRIAEAAVLAISSLLTTYFLFSGRGMPALPLTFVVLPFVLWAAIRFGQREVTTLVAAVCAIAVSFTVAGRGPFVMERLNDSLLFLLAFMSTVAVSGLVLNVVVGGRGRALASLQEAMQKVREQAITDPLTGLYNRRFQQQHLARELERAGRSGAPLALLMIDLDHFKRVNDASGHAAGDAVLRRVAAVLRSRIRPSDIACRHGGEEFVLILPGTTAEAARSKAEDLCAAFVLDREALHGVTASVGIALFPDHGSSADELADAADRAMYEAKAAGRNRVVTSSRRALP